MVVLAVDERDVDAEAARPGRGGEAAEPGAHDDHARAASALDDAQQGLFSMARSPLTCRGWLRRGAVRVTEVLSMV